MQLPPRSRSCGAEHSLEVRSEGLIHPAPTTRRSHRRCCRPRQSSRSVVPPPPEPTAHCDRAGNAGHPGSRPSVHRGSPLMCQRRTPGRGYQSVNSGRPRFPRTQGGKWRESSSPRGFGLSDLPPRRASHQIRWLPSRLVTARPLKGPVAIAVAIRSWVAADLMSQSRSHCSSRDAVPITGSPSGGRGTPGKIAAAVRSGSNRSCHRRQLPDGDRPMRRAS